MKRILLSGSMCVALLGAGVFASHTMLPGASQSTAARDLPSYRDVVKRVLPAVVSIEAKAKTKVIAGKLPNSAPSPFGQMPGLPDEFRRELERFGKQMPPPESAPGHSFGSGFIVDASGVILTNDHVVRGADEVTVRLQDGRTLTGRKIKRDPKTDLAVVKVEAEAPLPFIKLGDSNSMEIGDRVLAVGAPLGLTGTVTSGIVSAKGRDIHMNMYEDFLQTDAAINPGNSGGPLVNLDGEVIGINSAIKSGTGGFQGIGLAISSNLAKDVLDQLQKNGSVHRGYLGVQAGPLDPAVASKLGMTSKHGVVLAKVMPASPAARCGLVAGDVLTEVAGKAVKDARELQRIVAELPIGKQVELNVFRDGARKSLTMTVEEQPDTFGTAAESDANGPANLDNFGMSIVDLAPNLAKQFGFSEKAQGVLIVETAANGIAFEAGLRGGMLIVKVDQQSVVSASEAKKALEKGSLEKGILLQVRTPQDATAYVVLKAPSH